MEVRLALSRWQSLSRRRKRPDQELFVVNEDRCARFRGKLTQQKRASRERCGEAHERTPRLHIRSETQ